MRFELMGPTPGWRSTRLGCTVAMSGKRGTGVEGIPLASGNVAGGVVEFTKLRAGGRDSWTVAIDVIARPEDVAVNLESALGWLFDEYPLDDPFPALQNSYGYAAWLIQSAIPYPDSENAFRTS